jgi:hypothetical protein
MYNNCKVISITAKSNSRFSSTSFVRHWRCQCLGQCQIRCIIFFNYRFFIRNCIGSTRKTAESVFECRVQSFCSCVWKMNLRLCHSSTKLSSSTKKFLFSKKHNSYNISSKFNTNFYWKINLISSSTLTLDYSSFSTSCFVRESSWDHHPKR